MTKPNRAVVLLSGGLDSATSFAIANSEGFDCYAISFQYGQRHSHELIAAKEIARTLGAIDHVVLDINLRKFGGSALTSDINVPKDRQIGEMSTGIPVTYVPARNTVFLSLALAMAESVGAYDIFLGVNSLDYSGYPDCRPEYIAAFESMANLATKAATESKRRLKLHSPLIHMTKSEIIRTGLQLGVDYGQTSSCYDPGPEGKPCCGCDSCLLRMRGFEEAGVFDPILVRYGISL